MIKKNKLTIKEMQEIAKKRGGKCVSATYHNNTTHLKWECDKGHCWNSIPAHIKRGSWCPICSGKMKLTIEEMQEIATKRGGKCVSKKYTDSDTKLEWECNKGHKWKATPKSINRGSWCPECSGNMKLTLEKMKQRALEKGGKCLSKIYFNSKTPLKWECKRGHHWEALPSSVKQGSWCPKCAGNLKLTIEEMQQIAQNRGGRCLSKIYINNKSYLEWECSKGHTWKATPNSIKQGTWCPKCSYRKKFIIK